MTPQAALQRVIEHREIFHDEMISLMRQIMGGEVSPVMIAAIITGLRVKKETIGEIAAAASVMRELATPVKVPYDKHFVDIVGTGGDAAHTFNISSTSAFVVAAAGGKVAKHVGRTEQVAACIAETGFGFMFAPNHHSAMKHVAPVRREMGVRTIFNILGPLTNPAGAPNTLMGVFHPDLVGILVRVMQRLGAERVLVVHGKDCLDEISLGATTMVGELKDGEVREYEIHPEDYGLQMQSLRQLRVGSAGESREMLLGVLANQPSAAREVVCLNAGAALYVANVAESIGDGIAKAREAIASGAARAKLDQFVQCTQRLGGR